MGVGLCVGWCVSWCEVFDFEKFDFLGGMFFSFLVRFFVFVFNCSVFTFQKIVYVSSEKTC